MMYRLPPRPGEWIDRAATVEFTFEGERVSGFAGDTLSSALAAAGHLVLGRSFKYHRPRGIYSFANHDANVLLQAGDAPNVRGDVTPVAAGMAVTAVNVSNTVRRDRGRFMEWLAPFLPVGFYYKAFHGPRFPRWEARIRAFAGLGRIQADAPRQRTAKRYAFCDVLVVGAGPGGLAAALAAADAGARVLLVDENARAGGSAVWSGATLEEVEALVARVRGHARIEVLLATCAVGYYADHWVALVEPARMTKVRAGAVVFATGVVEQPAVFRNNDLPGVMLGSAAQRLLHRHAIAPGRRVAVLTANQEGYALARALREAGTQVVAVLDLRAGAGHDADAITDLRRVVGVEPVRAHSRADVLSAFEFRHAGGQEVLECDALLLSVGFAPAAQLLLQAGGELRFDAALQQHRPGKLPAGIFAAGRVNGVFDLAARRQDGRDAGTAAAAHALGVGQSSPPAPPATSRQVSHAYPVFSHPRARDFVDLDEDIQVKDLLHAAQEGYDSVELLKRYSTLGMGPSQGKHSNVNGARILMQARGQTLADTALTTQRPFFHSVALKQLAGAGFHVERRSACHEAHGALNAQWMTVGGWQRPEYYRRGAQPRAACIAEEARAVRVGVGLIDVSTLGKIEVHGPDAGRFLDRLYAGSYADMRVGTTRYGLLLDEGGVVRDDGVVARLGEQLYYVTTTTGGAATVYRDMLLWNTRWRLDCAFVNNTGHRAAVNLAGPASRELLRGLTDLDLSEEAFPFLAVRSGQVAGIPARLMRVGFVASLGFEIHVPFSRGAELWQALMRAGESAGIRAFGIEAQRLLRLEKGHAIVAQDTDGVTNPFEAGLSWAVKMRKPFFVGQRSLRIHQARGPRQQLVGLELPEGHAPVSEANLVIADGQIAGRLTSVGRSVVRDRTLALAMVSPPLSAPGTTLSLRASDGATVPATVVKTPFVEGA